MKLRNTRLIVLMAFALSASMVFSTNAFATSRPMGGANCTGSGCSGFNTGGYGTHLTNGSGTGNLAGYSYVRFDAYRPEPGLIPCTPDSSDRSLYSKIGIPSNYSGESYLHRNVAVLRSDTNIATNGVEDALYYNSGLKLYLGAPQNSAPQTAPTSDLDQSPTKSNPWIGPNWLGREHCLPLNGGTDVDDALKLIQPVLTVNGRESTAATPSRVILRSKKSTINLNLQTARDTNAVPQIDIAFDFNDIMVIGVDEKVVNKWKADNPGATDADVPLFLGWFDAKDKKSPFYIDTTPVSNGGTYNENGDNTFKIKYRKKGNYGLFVLASYDGIVFINGAPVPLGSSGVSSASNPVFFKVISVKSINRR